MLFDLMIGDWLSSCEEQVAATVGTSELLE